MGQKTGTSNIEKKVITNATQNAFVIAYLKPQIQNEKIITFHIKKIAYHELNQIAGKYLPNIVYI